MDNFDDLHRKRINKYLLAIEKLFDELVLSVSSVVLKQKLLDELFLFRKYPKIVKDVDSYLVSYRDRLLKSVKTYTEYEWDFANSKYDYLQKSRLDKVRPKISSKIYEEEVRKIARQSQNKKALEAFQERKAGKFTVSERVWNITAQAKENLELAIDVALKEGMSAQQLARSIKSNLNNPDALFRRVRDKHGNLVLSKNAKTYNPGQGVYRSAHKNALRLAANEINTAYRESEQIRIQSNPDVVGVKISLSPQHSVIDLCDELAGTYPKDFNWSSWHVSCKCYRTTILKTESEFIHELNNGLELPPDTSINFVADVPKNFTKWVDGYKGKKTPQFVENNKKLMK